MKIDSMRQIEIEQLSSLLINKAKKDAALHTGFLVIPDEINGFNGWYSWLDFLPVRVLGYQFAEWHECGIISKRSNP